MAGPLTANNKESPLLPALRRLFFEAWTCPSADLKHRLERRDDEPPRKPPAVEREERRLRLATGLGPGVQLGNSYEPSNALVNEAAEMFEESAIKYITWSRCTDRLAEVAGLKKVEEALTDNNGFIKLQRKVQKISADHHDLLRVQQCLTRRGVALDIAGMLTFEVHRRLGEEMLGAAQKPLPAAGFAQVTLDQLSAYDVEVWRRVAESTRSGIRPGADGARPLDAVLLAVLTEPRIAMLLLPHPTSLRGAAKATATGSDEEPELKKNKAEKKDSGVSGLKKELEAVKKKLAQA